MGLEPLFDLRQDRRFIYGQNKMELVNLLSQGEVDFSVFLSLSGAKEFQPILNLTSFRDFLLPKIKVASNGYSHDSLFNHWYVKDGSDHFGPFSMLQMLEFFQQKRLHLDNLVRHPSHKEWKAFSTARPFNQESRTALLKDPEVMSLVSRRRHPRIKYDNEVFISANGELYRGITWSLSIGGVGLVTDESTTMSMNCPVNIIINSNNEHGSVQVKAKVVNIRKEANYERVALEFHGENEFLKTYVQKRVPCL